MRANTDLSACTIRSGAVVSSDIVDSINKLKIKVLDLQVECERSSAATLPEVKSIVDESFVLDDLLDKVFKYREREPGTVSQIADLNRIDMQIFQEWLSTMALERLTLP